ncbi:hypothetical protein GURASL_21070 [Geotalea uraniireducens]|uniref:DUF177 domain-containing protein n=1 Tax=Geotalea uraniireducens TaxID=351604 RepID=A0ABN6VSW4_9BACT|nr:DUF177 domain-containing protein [Geotalea uraniireducens]BDV43184.1 hypothetical protein GURASL_21070 [Geotalea uraniireducens]
MKVRVDDIKEREKQLFYEEAPDAFPSLAAVTTDKFCTFIAPVTVSLTVFREYDHIRTNGKIKTRVRMKCSRCLAEFDVDVDSSFILIYSKANQLSNDEDEIELGDEDLISVAYTGDEIDFSPEIAEQVIMELPIKPLCKEDCQGLCPQCGADLNESECGCEKSVHNLTFSALKNFKVEK